MSLPRPNTSAASPLTKWQANKNAVPFGVVQCFRTFGGADFLSLFTWFRKGATSYNFASHKAGFMGKWEPVKTTLEIPDPLFKRVKAHAAMGGLKLKDVVASALSSYLNGTQHISKKRSKKCPFPLIRGKAGPLMREMSNDTVAKLLEEEDLERYRRSFGH
jgi:hypothetical protein